MKVNFLEKAIDKYDKIEAYIKEKVVPNDEYFEKDGDRATGFFIHVDEFKKENPDDITAYVIYVQKYDDKYFWNILEKLRISIDDMIDLCNDSERL